MIVGDAPTKEDQEAGRPFMSRSSQDILHTTLDKLGLSNEVYFTNCVSCRGCAQHFNAEGQPSINRDGSPYVIDQAPNATQLGACRTRLEEEIYMVDPVLIVALGGVAAEALLRRSVSVQAENGTTHSISIPGAGFVPKLTDKKKRWVRITKGQVVAPIEQNTVNYLCVISLHPTFVNSNAQDMRPGSPVESFVSTFTLIRNLYNRIVEEIPGITNAR
jgi:uracil-DNA glycosylase family 4